MTALQVFEETVDLVFALEGDQAVVDGFGFQHGVGGVGCFALQDAGAETVEHRCRLVGGGEGAGGVDFANGAGAAIAGVVYQVFATDPEPAVREQMAAKA